MIYKIVVSSSAIDENMIGRDLQLNRSDFKDAALDFCCLFLVIPS